MASKRDITKWLELERKRREREVGERAIAERDSAIDAVYAEAYTDEVVDQVFELLTEINSIINEWKQRIIDQHADAKYCIYSYGGAVRIGEGLKKDDVKRVVRSNFELRKLHEIKNIEDRGYSTRQEIRNAYDQVINNVTAQRSAKLALEYLRSIGFDTSDLETNRIETRHITAVNVNALHSNQNN